MKTWALLALAALLPLSGGEVSVSLRPQVTLAAERATLGDVADMSGDAGLIAVLRDLPIMELPDLAQRHLEADEVRRAVGHGLGRSLAITGTCDLSRRGRQITEDELIATARATITSDGDQLNVTTLRSPGALVIPDGGAETHLDAVALDRARIGDIPIRVRVLRGEVELARALITMRVVRQRDLLVAARPIKRGERIGAGDLRQERVTLTHGWNEEVTSKELLGREARLDLAEGTPLTTRLTVQPPDVRVGQRVVLQVISERFQLTVQGEALNDGRIGEVIPVRRASDGRTVRGTVIAEGQVRLDH